MCMSCGCGEADARHKQGDITREDLELAAINADIEFEQAADNIHQSARQLTGKAGKQPVNR